MDWNGTGANVWLGTLEGENEDAWKVQQEIATSIALMASIVSMQLIATGSERASCVRLRVRRRLKGGGGRVKADQND